MVQWSLANQCSIVSSFSLCEERMSREVVAQSQSRGVTDLVAIVKSMLHFLLKKCEAKRVKR